MAANNRATCRQRVRAMIAPIVAKMPGAGELEIRRALAAARPACTQSPYAQKIWYEEIRLTLARLMPLKETFASDLFPADNHKEDGPYARGT